MSISLEAGLCLPRGMETLARGPLTHQRWNCIMLQRAKLYTDLQRNTLEVALNRLRGAIEAPMHKRSFIDGEAARPPGTANSAKRAADRMPSHLKYLFSIDPSVAQRPRRPSAR